MRLTCPFCDGHDIVQEGMTGLYVMMRGKECQLPSWECKACGWSGPEDDFR